MPPVSAAPSVGQPDFQAPEPAMIPGQPPIAMVQSTVPPVQSTVPPGQPTVAMVQPTVSPGQPTVSPGQPTASPVQPTVADAVPATAAREPRRVDFNAVPALLLQHLLKAFGPKIAVNDLSLAVPPGCLFGLVGPNGAGKTTTLSMVTGLLRPDHGAISVLGRDVWSDPAAAKALMGVLPDGMRLFDRLTGREMVLLSGQLRGLSQAVIQPRADALLAALGLTADATTMVADYSAGMTKKIGLACALVHNPSLVILDEPFESVDPVSGEAIRSILHDFVDRGGTVVMSSHVMELVETLCDAVAVIAEGRILALGGIEQVCDGKPLQQRFLELVGVKEVEMGSLSWLGQS